MNGNVDKLYAEAFIDGANPELGQSKPVIIYADGEQYVLKNDLVDGEKQDAAFFQELLCCFLANKLGVPVPSFAIIELEREFLDNNPSLRFSHKFKEGIYFATKLLPNVENNLVDNYILSRQQGQPKINRSWNSFFKGITNKESIPSIIAFDILVLNFDRYGNEGNILVTNNGNEGRLIYAIDHGYAFGNPYYKKEELKKIGLLEMNENLERYLNTHVEALLSCGGTGINLGPIFNGLEQNLDFSDNPFYEIIQKIEELDEKEVLEMLDNIPTEWVSGGDAQKKPLFEIYFTTKAIGERSLGYFGNERCFF